MVAKKRLPSLRRRSPPPRHILGNRRLPDIDAELEKLAVNSWGAPERVCNADVSDQVRRIWRRLRPATARSRSPSPIRAETCAMPTNNGFWSNNCQGAQDTRG